MTDIDRMDLKWMLVVPGEDLGPTFFFQIAFPEN